jgi:hypothetical protein
MTPLDLQMIFSQAEKVGKEVAEQKEGAALHSVIRASAKVKQDEEKAESIHEAEERFLDKLDKHESGQDSDGKKKKSKAKTDDADVVEEMSSVHDPNLGKYIDISG